MLSFKIRPASELKTVMDTYCTLQNLQIDKVLFNFGTSRVNSSQTPGDLKMKDRDIMVASWWSVGSEAKSQAAEEQVQGQGQGQQGQGQGTLHRSADGVGRADFTTGTDSPVSILSSTMMVQGQGQGQGTLHRSAKSEEVCGPFPFVLSHIALAADLTLFFDPRLYPRRALSGWEAVKLCDGVCLDKEEEEDSFLR